MNLKPLFIAPKLGKEIRLQLTLNLIALLCVL